MAQTKDFYELLGVNRDASVDEIKKAFRQQARKYHPDNKETGNEEIFKEISQAYEILSDPQKRAIYDQYGVSGLRSTYGEDVFDFAFSDLSDLFSEFFGGPRTKRSSTGPERGTDIRHSIEIDFLEAIKGCSKEITIKPLEDCGTCKGSGARPGSKLKACKSCGGIGEVRKVTESFFGHVTQITTCPSCYGSGKIVEQPCTECDGKGQKRTKRTVDVKVPCGVEDGSRLRWGGKGDAGKRGGPPGDLYVVIQVKDHEIFIREGQDIVIQQTISFSQAALGGTINVPTTEGEKPLTIPSGIQSGAVLKVHGLGVPRLNNMARRGDQLIQIIIETPTKLTNEEKKIFEQLSKLNQEKVNKKFGIF